MVVCFLCKQTIDLKILKHHFTLKHGDHEFVEYFCCEDQCARSFHLYNSYRRHLEKCHLPRSECNPQNDLQSNIIEDINLVQPSCPEENKVCNAIADVASCSSSSSSYTNPIGAVQDKVKSVDDVLSTYISTLYGNTLLPRSIVQNVVDGLRNCLTSLVPIIGKCITDNCVEKSIPIDISKSITEEMEGKIRLSLDNFTTERKRFNYFKNYGSFIEPQAIVVGERFDKVKNQGVSRLVPVECFAQFIPLRQVLKNFFSLDGILSETLQYMDSLYTKEVKENFVQGSYWKNRMTHHSDKTLVPLFMYFDDYETGNVLGSHAGIHKLGAVYVSIPCLPPWRSSALTNIFLTLLFHSSDRTAFGNRAIFRSLISEFNYLIESGIDFDLPTFKGKLYFELGVILGDNLGLHSLTGFVESFSANYSCRTCKVSKSILKEQFYEDESLLRNLDMYERDLHLNDPSLTGIKERCVFLDIKYFDMFQQTGVDVMHDILEGVAKYVVSFMLLQYTQTLNLFSLAVLNEKMSTINLGPDNKNRPCQIDKEHINRGALRISSGEMLTLLRFLGILIGDFVPRDNEIWILYVKLRKIVDIAFSLKIHHGTPDLLQILVAEFNELYIKVTKDSLKPKFHNMIHYHSALLKYGPIYSLWSMRFEAKHRHSKNAAKISSNHVNVSRTLAIKHQLQLNDIFHRGILDSILKLGPRKQILLSEIEYIQSRLTLDRSKSLIKVSWATMGSIHYSKGCILVYDSTEDGYLYMFLVIENVFVYSDQLIFSGNLLKSIDFDEHYFAYHVKPSDEYCISFCNSLPSPIPNALCTLFNGEQYVVLRSPL